MTFKIEWLDHGREPQCAPNPEHPHGIDIDTTLPGQKTCRTALPYPAKRCGIYIIECSTCGVTVGVTTAGRPDDPRSVRIPCKQKGRLQ